MAKVKHISQLQMRSSFRTLAMIGQSVDKDGQILLLGDALVSALSTPDPSSVKNTAVQIESCIWKGKCVWFYVVCCCSLSGKYFIPTIRYDTICMLFTFKCDIESMSPYTSSFSVYMISIVSISVKINKTDFYMKENLFVCIIFCWLSLSPQSQGLISLCLQSSFSDEKGCYRF